MATFMFWLLQLSLVSDSSDTVSTSTNHHSTKPHFSNSKLAQTGACRTEAQDRTCGIWPTYFYLISQGLWVTSDLCWFNSEKNDGTFFHTVFICWKCLSHLYLNTIYNLNIHVFDNHPRRVELRRLWKGSEWLIIFTDFSVFGPWKKLMSSKTKLHEGRHRHCAHCCEANVQMRFSVSSLFGNYQRQFHFCAKCVWFLISCCINIPLTKSADE